jgi:hypothetical protein
MEQTAPAKTAKLVVTSKPKEFRVPAAKKQAPRKTATRPRKRPKASESVDKRSCFVISPFGGYFDMYYTHVHVPAIEAAGVRPIRADDPFTPGAIVNDIWRFIQSADVLIADLTGRNPNVFYELGLAHAARKPVIILTQRVDDVPFDLQGLRWLLYDVREPDWSSALRDKLTASIKETLESDESAILPTFLAVDTSKKTTVTPDEQRLLALERQVETLQQAYARQATAYPTLTTRPITLNFTGDAPTSGISGLTSVRGFQAPPIGGLNVIPAASTRSLFYDDYGHPSTESILGIQAGSVTVDEVLKNRPTTGQEGSQEDPAE